MFQHPADDLIGIPGPCGEFFLLVRITVNYVLNPPEQKFHEDRLRACPATPDPAVGYGKKDDEDHQGDHADKEQVEILGPELNTENNEGPVEKVKEQQLLAVYFYKRGSKEEHHQQYAGDIPGGR